MSEDIYQDHLLDKLGDKLGRTQWNYFASSAFNEVYNIHCISITFGVRRKLPKFQILVVLENIKIEIINNNIILKTWYQNNPANLLRFPG